MRYKLSLLLTEQPEGEFTITCRELPELITECDSLDEMIDNVIDAFHAVVGLYEHKQRPLPADIQIFDDGNDELDPYTTSKYLDPMSEYTENLKQFFVSQKLQMVEIPTR